MSQSHTTKRRLDGGATQAYPLTSDEDFARDAVRCLIDLGAACQKARSFTTASPETEMRSVYDVMAERFLISLRKQFR